MEARKDTRNREYYSTDEGWAETIIVEGFRVPKISKKKKIIETEDKIITINRNKHGEVSSVELEGK